MIRSSFIILPRISTKSEQNMWHEGIKDWHQFLNTSKVKGISKHKKPYFDRMIEKAQKNLYTFNSSYFTNLLPQAEHWRLYNFFKDECCFLDIETSTVHKQGYITALTLYDGVNTKTMVRNYNLDFKNLKQELGKYKMLISFNGSAFDLPFLEKQYPGIIPGIPHLDLKHACARLNLKGGLKHIEKQLNIKRPELVEKMYGGDAILLWRRFLATGDNHYLKLLIEYNEQDTINLKKIADYTYLNLSEELYKTLV